MIIRDFRAELPRHGARPTNAASYVGGASFFVCSAIVFPLILCSQLTFQASNFSLVVAQLLVVVYAGARLSVIFSRGERDWFGVVLFGFSYAWLGIAPLVQAYAAANPLRISQSSETAAEQALLVLAGLVAYDLGCLSAERKARQGSAAPRRPRATEQPTQRMLQQTRVKAIATLSIVATPWFVGQMGGTAVLFSSRYDRQDVLVSAGLFSATSKVDGALLSAVASVLPFVSQYGLICLLRHDGAVRRQPTFWVLFVGVLASNLLLNNPISSSRFWVLVILLAIALVTLLSSARGVRTVILGFAFGGVLVFPYLDYFRASDAAFSGNTVVGFLVQKTDYDSMVQIGNSIDYVSDYGIVWGRQLLGAVLFWVPRASWGSKPVDTGSLLAEYIGYPNQNLSGPLWAELFLNFGIVGLFLCMFYIGWLYRPIAVRYMSLSLFEKGSMTALQFIFPVICLYGVLLLRGSLIQAMGRLVVLLVVLFLCTGRRQE